MKFSLLLLAFFLLACERIEYYPDKPLDPAPSRILGHRGGGYSDGGNTLASCQYGFSKLDGVEIDIQKSLDNTPWLNYTAYTTACGSFSERCFPNTSDALIMEIDKCLGQTANYTTLEEVFQLMSERYPTKYASLDVKAWDPCDLGSLNVLRQMNDLAQRIIDLTKKYKLENKIMVECQTGDFLYYIKKNCNFIETYLTVLGDFELGVSRTLDAGFSGISFQFRAKESITKEQVDLLHRKGLKIQLWLVNETDEMQEALATGADFIQTDNF